MLTAARVKRLKEFCHDVKLSNLSAIIAIWSDCLLSKSSSYQGGSSSYSVSSSIIFRTCLYIRYICSLGSLSLYNS